MLPCMEKWWPLPTRAFRALPMQLVQINTCWKCKRHTQFQKLSVNKRIDLNHFDTIYALRPYYFTCTGLNVLLRSSISFYLCNVTTRKFKIAPVAGIWGFNHIPPEQYWWRAMGMSVRGLSGYELTQPLRKTMRRFVSQKGAHGPCLRPRSSPVGVYPRQTCACHTTSWQPCS